MYWLARSTLNEILQTMINWKGQSASQVLILSDAVTYLEEHKDRKTEELTASELFVSQGWDRLQPATIHLIHGPNAARASKDWKKDVHAMLHWLEESSIAVAQDGCILPYWSSLDRLFLLLEQLKAYDKFCDAALTLAKQKSHHAHGKLPVDVYMKIKIAARQNAGLIQRHAKEWRKRLEKNGKEEILKAFRSGGEVGRAIEDVVGVDRMMKYAKEFVESGIEALDGIAKVKV